MKIREIKKYFWNKKMSFLLFIGLICSNLAIGTNNKLVKHLNFKKVDYFSVSLVRKITDFSVYEDDIFYLSFLDPSLYWAKIKKKAKYKDQRISSNIDVNTSAIRISLMKKSKKFNLNALTNISQNKLAILDGIDFKIKIFDNSKKAIISSADIIIDKIAPPPDSRGLPPKKENLINRKNFLRSINKNKKSIIFSGITFLKKNSQSLLFLSSTLLKKFPLVLIECSLKNPSYCYVKNNCFIDQSIFRNTALVSISYNKKKEYLVFSDKSQNRVLVYKYQNCFHSKEYLEIHPPKLLKKLTASSIDNKDNLWLSTEELDNYHNANIYSWKLQDWKN